MKYKSIIFNDKEAIKDLLMYAVISLLAIICFIYLYSARILNPTNTDWLMAGGDLSQHYLGWKAYRYGAWQFPIGMTDRIAYPDSSSVIFTDSIPLLAVFFKILSPVLPPDFQYFGWWGLACFILQGILPAKILHRFIHSRIACVICSVFFVTAPIMIWRMYVHTALAGQWLILLSMEPLFNYDRYKDRKKIYWKVALIGLLSASIHLYFLLMMGIIVVGICVADFFISSNNYEKTEGKIRINFHQILREITLLGTFIVTALVVVWILGGFSSGFSAGSDGLGKASMNLDAFTNPMGWSDLLKDQATCGDTQYEGFSYLGFGCVFLVVIAFLFAIGSWEKTKIWLRRYKFNVLAIFFVCIAEFIVAISPVVTYKDRVLYTLTIPSFLKSVWSVFRSTGRYSWPIVYVLMLGSILVIYKLFNKRTLNLIIIFSLLLQGYDLHTYYIGKHQSFKEEKTYDTLLKNKKFWNKIASDKELKHFYYYGFAWNVGQPMMFSLTDWALTNGKTLNDFYFGRARGNEAIINRDKALKNLSSEDVILFPSGANWTCGLFNLHYYSADGLIIGTKEVVSGVHEINPGRPSITRFAERPFYIGDEIWQNVENSENNTIVKTGDAVYGSYMDLPLGKYTMEVHGNGFNDNTKIRLYSNTESKLFNYKVVSISGESIKIDMDLNDYFYPAICIENKGTEEILLNSVEIEYKILY